MFVELGDTLYVVKGNHSSTTGGLADPSAATAKWHEDGGAGSAVGVTVTAPFDSVTGQIQVAVVCSTGNGFELGKRYSLMLYTTTGGVASATEIANFQIVAAQNVAGYPVADLTQWNGSTLSSGMQDLGIVRRGSCQAGSTASTVKLDAGATVNLAGAMVLIVSGVGVGQAPRYVKSYSTVTQVGDILPNWTTTPDNTSGFVVFGFGTVDVVAVSGDSTAADNMELQYDGTGLSGASFPATQASITSLASDAAAGLSEVTGELDGIQAKTDNLPVDPAAESTVQAAIASVQADADRIRGLLHENSLDDSYAYDVNGNLTSCRKRVFASKAAVPAATGGVNGADGEIARYTLTFGYTDSRLSSFKWVRDL